MATEVLELDVKTNIKGVTKDVEKLGKSVKKTAGEAEKLDEATEKGASGFKKVGVAARALGAAIKAIGIGLVIAAFVALKEAFMRNQKAADFLKTTMSTISITFNELVNIIVHMVEWVQKNSDQFEPYIKVMKGLVTFGIEPLKLAFNTTEVAIRAFMDGFMRLRKFLGEKGLEDSIEENMRVIKNLQGQIEESGKKLVEAGGDIYENFGEANDIMNKFFDELGGQVKTIDLKKNFELAESLTEIEKEAARALITFDELNAQFLKDAEVQRQLRDDISKTFAERLEANTKLSEILKEQEKLQRAQIQTSIDAAAIAFEANATEANGNLLRQEKLRLLQLEETLTGQASEQKTNQVALEKELLEAQRELAAAGLSNKEKELKELENNYKIQLDLARRAGESDVALKKEYERQKSAIVKAGITEQLDAYANLAGALGQLAGENKHLAIAEAIIATYTGATKALGATGTPIDWVNAAAIIAAGFANVRKIMQTDVGDGGGGGGAPAMATPQAPAPEMMSGSFTLGGSEEIEPARAYVVSDDITNNQNKLAIIRRRATI